MGSNQPSPVDLLKKIFSTTPEDILKQMEMFEASYPLLISYAKRVRESNSAKTKMDQKIHNAEMINAFIYFCEHNYWLFLILTHNFAKIQELILQFFGRKDAPWIELVDKELKKLLQEQNPLVMPLKIQTPKTEELPKTINDWIPYAMNTTSMDLYRYYNLMLKQANYDYITAQSKIYYHAADARVQRLDKLVALLKASDQISLEDKEKFYLKVQAHKDRIAVCKEKLDAVNERIQKATPNDISVVEEQLQASKDYFDATSDLSKLFKEYKHLNRETEAIFEENEKETLQVKIHLDEAKIKHEERVVELMQHFKNVQKEAKKDAENSLSSIIDIAKNCPKKTLSPEQQNMLNESLFKLKKCLKALNETEDYESMQRILSECSVEIKKIESIPRQTLSEGSAPLQTFDKEVTKLNSMILDPLPSPIRDEQSVLANETVLQDHANKDFSSKVFIEETNETVLNLQNSDEAPVASSIDFSEKKEQPAVDNAPNQQSNQNPTITFRGQLNGFRSLTISEGEQIKLMDILDKIQLIVLQTKNSDFFNPEDDPKLDKILLLKNTIESQGLNQMKQTDIQMLYEAINEIENGDEYFDEIKDDLSAIFPFLESAPNDDMRLS